MVATQRTEIFKDVLHVLSLNIFTHVHWQIDAIWSNEGIWKEFKSWTERYNRDIRKLVDFWLEEMKRGIVHGVVPFLGVLSAMERGYDHPPCGSGFNSFAITPDGRILACPICPDFEWNELGTIYEGRIKSVEIIDPCPECEYFSFCGGRCLFFNRERFWGQKGFELVCSTAKNLIDVLLERKDEILKHLPKELLKYPKYPNTTEIIP
jgi:putative peptide-modifying radical SAM enzyme